MNHYETVFILNPVLSDDQIKETVKKYEDFLVSRGAKQRKEELEINKKRNYVFNRTTSKRKKRWRD